LRITNEYWHQQNKKSYIFHSQKDDKCEIRVAQR